MNRLLSLDLIKLLAMFGVVCLHTEMAFYDNPIAKFLYMTAVVSIPLFFMASGYLLYGKKNVTYKYSVKKIFGILRFVTIISVALWLLSGIRHGQPFFSSVLGCYFQKGNIPIFWYFGAMIILYSLFPLLHRIFREYPKFFILCTVFLCLLSNVIFIANFFGIYIEENTIQTFRLWIWLFYFNLGGILRKCDFKSHWFVISLLFVANFLFQYKLTLLKPTVFCEYFYSSIPVMLLSLVLFVTLVKINNNKLQFINGGQILLASICTSSFNNWKDNTFVRAICL